MEIKSVVNGSALNATYKRGHEIMCDLQGIAHELTIECTHTYEVYSVLAMCDGERIDGRHSSLSSTALSFDIYDNDIEKRKQLTFAVHGDAEREILIDLLKAATEVLETSTLTIEV